MPQQRLLVPDCSVMIAASFPSELIVGGMAFDLSSRARPLAAAIRSGAVRGVAPEMLMIEFLKVSFDMAFTRSGAAATDSMLARAQVLSFQQLPFTWIPADEIAAILRRWGWIGEEINTKARRRRRRAWCAGAAWRGCRVSKWLMTPYPGDPLSGRGRRNGTSAGRSCRLALGGMTNVEARMSNQ